MQTQTERRTCLYYSIDSLFLYSYCEHPNKKVGRKNQGTQIGFPVGCRVPTVHHKCVEIISDQTGYLDLPVTETRYIKKVILII